MNPLFIFEFISQPFGDCIIPTVTLALEKLLNYWDNSVKLFVGLIAFHSRVDHLRFAACLRNQHNVRSFFGICYWRKRHQQT